MHDIPYDNPITKYWLEFYSSSSGHCTLCSNSGKIDTANTRHGRINFCICPNGQQLRDSEKHFMGHRIKLDETIDSWKLE